MIAPLALLLLAVEAWSLPTAREIWRAGPVATYATDRAGITYLLANGQLAARARDGTLRWSMAVPGQTNELLSPVAVDGVVVLAAGGDLLLVDAETGVLLRRLDLGGAVDRLLGPPLVAHIRGVGSSPGELVVLDPRSGRVGARRSGSADALYDGRLVEIGSRLRVLDPATLRVLASSQLQGTEIKARLWAGESHLFLSYEEHGCGVLRPLDLRTGEPGPPLPALSCHDGDTVGPSLAVLLVGGTWFLVRRDETTGRERWRAPLPVEPHEWIGQGDDVLVLGVRGVLAILDRASGRIRRLLAAPAPDEPGRRPRCEGITSDASDPDDRTLVASAGGLVSISTREADPPEHDPAGLAMRLLRNQTGRPDVPARLAELVDLGPEAVVAAARLVSSLDPPGLEVAAALLARAGYAPAAPALAARCAEAPPLDDLVSALADALDVLAGPGEVPVLAKVLADRSHHDARRLRALMILAHIGTVAAVEAIEAGLLAEPRKSWWNPPDPQPFLADIGRPDHERAVERAQWDWPRVEQLTRAGDAFRLPRPGGGALIVFRDSWLGSPADFWVAEIDRDGHLGPTRFAGEVGFAYADIAKVRKDGERLVVASDQTGHPSLTIELAALPRDSDGDGLTDLVESRLGLDPASADSDGDGIPDPEDAAPGGGGTPQGESEEIQAALLAQLVALDGWRDPGAAVFVTDGPRIEWAGRPGPTVSAPSDDPKETELRGAGQRWPEALVTFEPTPDLTGLQVPPPTLGPDERLWSVFRTHSPPSGYTDLVRVRRVQGRWLLVERVASWGE